MGKGTARSQSVCTDDGFAVQKIDTELWSVPLDAAFPPLGVAGHLVGAAQMGYGTYQLFERHGEQVEKEIEARREMLGSWKFFDSK